MPTLCNYGKTRFHNNFMVSNGGSRIFPEGGRQLPKCDYFFNILPKTAWKWKNLGPGGAPGTPPLDPSMDSAFSKTISNL